MSTASTSSTSTSMPSGALPGRSAKRGAAKPALQAPSAIAAAPIAPPATIHAGASRPPVVKSRRASGGIGAREPAQSRPAQPHSARSASARMNPGSRRPARTSSGQSLPVTLPRHARRAAATGEFVVEGEAVGAVVHADLFARRDAAQRHDLAGAVIAGIGVAGVIDEIDRVAHGLGAERAGDRLRRGVVGIAQEDRAQRGLELLHLLRRQRGKAPPLLLVAPLVLAEQARALRDRAAGEQAVPAGHRARLEQGRRRAWRFAAAGCAAGAGALRACGPGFATAGGGAGGDLEPGDLARHHMM